MAPVKRKTIIPMEDFNMSEEQNEVNESVTEPVVAEPAESQTVPVHVVEELRAKARKAEEALSALQAQEDERAKAELSELDRLKLELDEAKTTATKAQAQAVSEAKKSKARVFLVEAGAHNNEKALRLLDLDGTEQDAIGGAVKALTESDPYLFRSGDNPGSVGTPSETGQADGDNNGPDQDLLWLQQSGLI